MRIFPIITALVVVTVLYLLVFERDRAFELAGVQAAPETTAVAAEPTEDTAATGKVFSVVAQRSEAREISGFVVVRGRTEATRQVNVLSETSGKVISEPRRKGTTVEAGDLLCELDPGTRQASLAEARARLPEALARIPEAESRLPEAQGRLAEAEARVNEAQINLTAAQKLFEDGFASEARVASAEAAFESAQAGVQTARAALAGAQSGVEAAKAGIETAGAAIAAAEKEIERLTITAPFGGFLESDTAELGSLLQPGALCATVIQLDPVKLVGFIPEVEVGRVTVGAQAGARLLDGTQLVGAVTFLSRSADPNTRTFRVEIEVPNPDAAIRDGQTVEIAIAAEGQQAHLVPMSALTLDNDGVAGVRVVEENQKVGFQPVKVLRDSPDGIWVSGLPDTAEIIVVGQEYVTNGLTVDVTYREPGL